ncbi:MAG: SDR family NAD(P)-dependent oxidoreductase [Dehalococcoidia bacterium]
MADTLKDKVAVITGAGRGIGRAVALFFAQEGAKVVVNDPGVNVDGTGGTTAVADEVVAEIRKAGGQAVASYDSVATMQGGENIIKAALNNFGKLDIVVTCAGILRDRMVFNMTEEEWDAVIATHLKGTFTVVKPACVIFRQQRSGRIITFSSESGLVGNSGQANYGAAKSGIAGFTKVVARDMGRYGVTANSIAPRALTRMTAGVPEAARQIRAQRGIAGIEEEEGISQWQPEDIAPFVAYLASDFAANINGQVFLVYGDTIALMSQPRLIKTIYKPTGYWTVEELREVLPKTLAKGLVNPAPPQPPQPAPAQPSR